MIRDAFGATDLHFQADGPMSSRVEHCSTHVIEGVIQFLIYGPHVHIKCAGMQVAGVVKHSMIDPRNLYSL